MSESERTGLREPERTGVGDEYPDERTMNAQPGLSGGEYPGADEVADEMAEALTPDGEETSFGGAVGGYGPEGAMGTVEPGNASDAPPADDDDTQYGLGPARQ